MKKPQKNLTGLVCFAAATFIGSCIQSSQAATIDYVGEQYNVELFTNDPTTGWRNAGTLKTHDADGDQIIGTDGYDFAGISSVIALPSYVASLFIGGGHNDDNRGLVDDPTNPSGADIGLGWNGNGSATIVFTGSSLASKTLRLAVLFDSTWSGIATGTQEFTLSQTVGGSSSASSGLVTLGNDGLDVAYFDITGIQDGDTFNLAYSGGTTSWKQLSGIAFDVVGPGSGSAYDTWAGAGVAFDADANNDGVDNGLAWVLGAADPSANAIALLPTLDNTSDPDFFIFTYRRDDDANTDPSTTIKVEYGSDLAGWTEALAGADIIITPTDDGAGAGIDLVQVKIRRTLAVGGKLFARLNVANSP